MLREAAFLYNGREFICADLRQLPFPTDHFDWAICRGLEGATRTYVSNRDWKLMEAEMLRVARRLLVIDYSCNHRVIERAI